MLKSKQVKNKQVVYFADIDDIFDNIDEKFVASGEKYEGPVVYKGVVEKKPHEPTYVVFGDDKIRVSTIDDGLFKTLSEAIQFIESSFSYEYHDDDCDQCNCCESCSESVVNFISLILETDSYEDFMDAMNEASDHAVYCNSEVVASIGSENSGSIGFSWYIVDADGDIIGEGSSQEEAIESAENGVVILSREDIKASIKRRSKKNKDSTMDALKYFCEL